MIGAFFLIALAVILLASKSSQFNWEKLAHVGTFLQGLAAVFVVLIGLVKGDEVLDRIKDLRESLEGIRKVVDETNTVIKTLPPLPVKAEASEIDKKLEASLLREYWEKQLADFPEKAEKGKLLYIPNKSEVIEELSKPLNGLEDQVRKAVVLKASLRTNDEDLPKGTNVTADVRSTENGGFRIQVNKAAIDSTKTKLKGGQE